MKFEKFGYWVMNDIVKPLTEKKSEDPEPDVEIMTDDPEVKKKLNALSKAKKIKGTCTMSIQIRNHGQYLKWKTYFGVGRQWEFVTSYPAIMRAEYTFTNSLEVEMIAKKVVQLLEMGFDVYSAQWKLEEKDDPDDEKSEETEEEKE